MPAKFPVTHPRGAVEPEFGRLKNEWALLPFAFVDWIGSSFHADLTILAKLS